MKHPHVANFFANAAALLLFGAPGLTFAAVEYVYTTSWTPGEVFSSLAEAESAMREAALPGGDYLENTDSVTDDGGSVTYTYETPDLERSPSGWEYFAYCAQKHGPFSSESEAEEFGIARYFNDCGDGHVVNRSKWLTIYTGGLADGCGLSLGPGLPLNPDGSMIEMEARSSGIGICQDQRFGSLGISRERIYAACPEGYRFSGYLPEFNTCINDLTGIIWGTPSEDLLGKQNGGGDCDNLVGNPCNAATGNKYQREVDYQSPAGVSFVRHYNSHSLNDVGLGTGWRTAWHRRLEPADGVNEDVLVIRRADGRGEPWRRDGDRWVGDADTRLDLRQQGNGFQVRRPDGGVEAYNASYQLAWEADPAGNITRLSHDADGNLKAVTGPWGHRLTFSYDETGHLATVTDPGGGVHHYSYDDNGNLASVTHPDGSTRTYHYEIDVRPRLLTDITDENGDRFATFVYDYSNTHELARVTRSHHAKTTNATFQEEVILSFLDDTTTYATGVGVGVGGAGSFVYERNLGVKNLVAIDSAGIVTQEFDERNNRISCTDQLGTTITYGYNAANQLTAVTEAAGTELERTTRYEYLSPDLDLPTRITRPSVAGDGDMVTEIRYENQLPVEVQQQGYAPDGTVLNRSVNLTRNYAGFITAIDGPRTDIEDVTHFTWHMCTTGSRCGQLASHTDPTGHVTIYNDYDTNGRLLQRTDPDGLVTHFGYDFRGRLIAETQSLLGNEATSRTTRYTYDGVGQLTALTLPNGLTLTYTWDAAHDLRVIEDSDGNRIDYDYDEAGNVTDVNMTGADGELARRVWLAYNTYARQLWQLKQGGLYPETGGYSDARVGRDTLGRITWQQSYGVNRYHTYDALHRLSETLEPDYPNGPATNYTYDNADNLLSLVAFNGAETTWTWDDFGNRLTEQSPDWGQLEYLYDLAGNAVQVTGARGITHTRSYDALNRLTGVDYPGEAEDIAYQWDDCDHGAGRLCRVMDTNGVVSYTYDGFGNTSLLKSDRFGVEATIRFDHDAENRLTGITYPDGSHVDYHRDPHGRIIRVTLYRSDGEQVLSSDRQHRADGLLFSHTLGNGLQESRHYDLAGKLTSQDIPDVLTRTYTYEGGTGLLRQTQDLHNENGYYYRSGRLELAFASDSEVWDEIITYRHDVNDNRSELLRSDYDLNIDMLTQYQYALASNHLTEIDDIGIARDAAGNRLTDHSGIREFSYNSAGRLEAVAEHGLEIARYDYDYRGLRIRKEFQGLAGTGTTLYHYDTAGRLLAETDADGTLRRMYVWADDTPLALIVGTPASIGSEVPITTFHGVRQWDSGDIAVSCEAYHFPATGYSYSGDTGSGAYLIDPDGAGGADPYAAYCDMNTSGGGWTLVANQAGSGNWIPLDSNLSAGASYGSYPDSGQWRHEIHFYRAFQHLAHDEVLLRSGDPEGAWCVLGYHEVRQPQSSLDELSVTVLHAGDTAIPAGESTNHLLRSGNAEDPWLGCEGDHWANTGRMLWGENGTHWHRHYKNDHDGIGLFVRGQRTRDPDGSSATVTVSDPKIYYFHTDHLGTPRLLTDEDGEIAWKAIYQPFGSVEITISEIENPLRFPGQYYDEETGLHYNWHRYYDPEIGRYISPDPLGLTDGTNPYAYAQNNPVHYVDPTGLFCLPAGPARDALIDALSGAAGGAVTGGISGGLGGAIAGSMVGGAAGALTGLAGIDDGIAGGVAGGAFGAAESVMTGGGRGGVIGGAVGGAIGGSPGGAIGGAIGGGFGSGSMLSRLTGALKAGKGGLIGGMMSDFTDQALESFIPVCDPEC